MFGRRPFQRPRRPMAVRPRLRRLPPRARRALARANCLMAAGDFEEAATVFGEMADRVAARGRPVPAAHLALQASRAHFAGRRIAPAVERAKVGLQSLVSAVRAGQAAQLLPRIIAAFRGQGYDEEATEVEAEVEGVLGEVGLSLEELKQRRPSVHEGHGTLPARCPGCGASLVLDEVDWHGPATAACVYCGSALRAT